MTLSQEYRELTKAAVNDAAPTRRGGRFARKPRNKPTNKTTNSGTTAKPPQKHNRADPKLAQACLQMAGSKKTNQKQACAMRRFSDWYQSRMTDNVVSYLHAREMVTTQPAAIQDPVELEMSQANVEEVCDAADEILYKIKPLGHLEWSWDVSFEELQTLFRFWALEMSYLEGVNKGKQLPVSTKLQVLTSVYREFAREKYQEAKDSGEIAQNVIFDDWCNPIRLQFPELYKQLTGEGKVRIARGQTPNNHAAKALSDMTIWCMLVFLHNQTVGGFQKMMLYTLCEFIGCRSGPEADFDAHEFSFAEVEGWQVTQYTPGRLAKNRKLDKKLKLEHKFPTMIIGVNTHIRRMQQQAWRDIDPEFTGKTRFTKTQKAKFQFSMWPKPFCTSNSVSSLNQSPFNYAKEPYAAASLGGFVGDTMKQMKAKFHPGKYNGCPAEIVFKDFAHNTTISGFRKRMEHKLSKARVPSFNRNAAEGRSTKGDGSRDLYNDHTVVDQLKVALILHLPPLMNDWADPIPEYPGDAILNSLLVNHCRFDSAGYCKPIDIAALTRSNPKADLPLQPKSRPVLAIKAPPSTTTSRPSTMTPACKPTSDDFDESPEFLAALAKMEMPAAGAKIYNAPVTITINNYNHPAPPAPPAPAPKRQCYPHLAFPATRTPLSVLQQLDSLV